MKYLVIACLSLLAAAAPSAADSPSEQTRQRISAIEQQLEDFQKLRREVAGRDRDRRDVRGDRRESEDLRQWAFDEATEVQVTGLVKLARANDSAGREALDEADQIMARVRNRAHAIDRYWEAVLLVGWRDRWKIFVRANKWPVKEPAAELIATERASLTSWNPPSTTQPAPSDSRSRARSRSACVLTPRAAQRISPSS
jgi:hypothetical protein